MADTLNSKAKNLTVSVEALAVGEAVVSGGFVGGSAPVVTVGSIRIVLLNFGMRKRKKFFLSPWTSNLG